MGDPIIFQPGECPTRGLQTRRKLPGCKGPAIRKSPIPQTFKSPVKEASAIADAGSNTVAFLEGAYRSIWTPALIGPRNWYDPKQMVTFVDGQGVDDLEDFGYAGWDGFRGDPLPTFETNEQNGRPVIQFHQEFSSGGWRIESPQNTPVTEFMTDPGLSNGLTFFLAGVTEVGLNQLVWATRTLTVPIGHIGYLELRPTGKWRYKGPSDIFSPYFESNVTYDGQPRIVTLRISHGLQIELFQDGVRDSGHPVSATFAAEQDSFLFTSGTLGAETWRGQLFEILVFDNSLPDEQLELVEGYLAWVWGLTGNLPADHPYKNEPPMAP